MTDYIVVFVTAKSEKEGEKIAQSLLKEKLAACVNIVPGLKSVFRWKGKIGTQEEVLLLIKTKDRLFEKLKKRVIELHSYQVPEIIALGILAGFEKYLNWLEKETE
ncbi:MAG: divalent-cation tolerance protein CutA [candidate division Zixibacteria bacterium]|nr:divalent-cation tolerance protein CutA [candidate division Zixibacteria bacterium]